MNRFIIDGFNLAYRSHFAFNELRTASGLQSGCVYGFMVSLRALKKRFPGHHFTVVWDNEPTRKKNMFADYKADRPRFDLNEQLSDLKLLLSSLNIDQSEAIGEEADDVIASLVHVYSKEGGKVFIYTGDKDLLQLVKDGKVIVIKPKSGVNPEKIFDEEAVKEKYGVEPCDFASYLAFRGDNSDNIPGVPRAHSKILAYLVSKYKEPRIVYGSVKTENLTDYQLGKMLESEDQVYTNYSLIKLKDDLDCSISHGQSNEEKVQEYLDKYGVKALSADGLVRIFEEESSFSERQAPAIENISLF